MKNVFSALLIVFMLGTLGSVNVAFAQSAPEADKACAQVSKKMMQVLSLNELEYIKVKELNVARITKMTDVATKYSHDQAALETRFSEIEKEFETSLATILKKEKLEGYAMFKMTPDGDVMAILKKAQAAGPVSAK